MKSHRLALPVVAVLLFFLCRGFAQNTVADEKGILPYGSYTGGDVDQVDLKNGNLFVKIPLFSLPQLGKLKLSYSLVYNGQSFDVADPCNILGDGLCYTIYYLNAPIGPILTMDQALTVDVEGFNSGETVNDGIITYSNLPPSYSVVDSNQARHPLMFDANNMNNLHALDGSGYTYKTLSATEPYDQFTQGPYDPDFGPDNCTGTDALEYYDGNTIVDADGIAHTHQEQCGVSYLNPATVMTDPSGNQITYTWEAPVTYSPFDFYYAPSPTADLSNVGTVTDSVSRTIPGLDEITLSSDVSMCPNLGVSSQPATGSKTWTVPGPNGANVSYVFCMSDISYNTRFGGDLSGSNAIPGQQSGSQNYDPETTGTQEAIQSVVLPNGKYWGFIYNSAAPLVPSSEAPEIPDPHASPEGYGDITELLLPTGGSISYSYDNEEACSAAPQYKRFLRSRTVNDGNGTIGEWKYLYNNPTGTDLETGGNAGFFPYAPTFATPITTVTDPSNNDTDHIYTTVNPNPLLVLSQCTYFSETETDQYNGTGSGSRTLLKATTRSFGETGLESYATFATYNQQPTAETETLTNGAPVTTTYSYATSSSFVVPSCRNDDNPPDDCPLSVEATSVNFGQPTEQQITSTDTNSEKTVQTAYKWQSDSTALAANFLDYPSSIETDYASGTEAAKTTYTYDTKANLTQVSQDVTAGNPITTQSATYNSQGMPSTTTDGDGNTTTIGYDGSGLFPSEIARPATGGGAIAHNDYYCYDDNTGNIRLHVDENGSAPDCTVTTPDDPLHGTKSAYDVIGRLTEVTSPLTAAGRADTQYCYTDTGGTGCSAGSVPYQVYATTTASPDPSQQVIRTYDGLGRLIRSKMASDPEGAVSVDTVYNGDGQVAKVSNPYRGSASAWTQYAYDGLGRVAIQTQPDGSTLQWCYNNVATSGQTCSSFLGSGTPYTWSDSLDESGNHWQRSSDYFSDVTQVLEPDPGTNTPTLSTTYQYNPLNDLTSVNQAGAGSDTARTRTFSYDGLSRLLSATNPETGTTTYTYDNNSNVLTKIDARSITTTYSYDALNRVTGKTYSDGSPSVGYSYDTASSYASTPNNGGNFSGRLSSVTTTLADSTVESAKYVSGYDAVGRETGFIECGAYSGDCTSTTGEVAFSADYSYDLAGNVIDLNTGIGQLGQLTPENSDQSAYRYFSWDAAGRLNTAEANTDLSPGSLDFQATAYSPFGGLQTAVFPDENNNPLINVSRSYDPYRMWLSAESDSSPTAGSLYGYSLGFANNGNVNSVTDSVMGASTPSYDHLNRLTSSAYTAGLYNELTLSWSYDDFGNRTAQTPSGSYTGTVPGAQTLGFGNATNQITSGLSVTYDAAGNVSEDPSNQYLYDGEGRLCAVYNNGGSGAMTGYVYDGDGNRVAKGGLSSFSCDSTTNGFTLSNAYILGQSGEQLDEADSTGTEVHSNTFANGQLLSTYDNITSEWTVALNDWLGTKRVQVDPAVLANLTSFTSLPYGDALTPSGYDATEQHFTGKERDTESGNDYFGARYYASSMGRFMSPDDGRDQVAEDPQSWNLYSYVQNNPLRNVDPDGHDCVTQSRVDGSTESVSVSSGGCSGVAGNGTTQTYVNGTVNLSDIHTGADGHSIDIGFTGADGSTGVQNANSAPYADNPGISLGNNMSGFNELSGTNRVVNQIGGAMFGAESFFMGGLLGAAAPEAALGVGKTQVNFSNALAHNITALRGDHLPPPGSIAEIRQAVTAALNAGQYSTKSNGAIEGTVTIQGVQCGFRGAMVNGVMRISTVFANR